MSLVYYIASEKELPTGSFGTNYTLVDHRIVFETELDAAGIYITGPATNAKRFPHFRLPYVYQLSPEGGCFNYNPLLLSKSPEAYSVYYKCAQELFAYLKRNLMPGGEMEMYAGWDDGMGSLEEPQDQSLNGVLDLSDFELGEQFSWIEKQYILVKKS